MNCYYCGAGLGRGDVCPSCGTNVHYYKQIVCTSNALYNQGLDFAQERNLTGAIDSLQRALRLYKGNIDARNLLGLVYCEIGEFGPAIEEWSISKALKPEGNYASYYLGMLIGGVSRGELAQTISKYNSSLIYAEQGSMDLATVQLKKIISDYPGFLKAHYLLALIYAKAGQIDLAKAQMRLASRVDRKNPETRRLTKLINQEKKTSGVRKTKARKDSVSYQSGNETIIQPIYEKLGSPKTAITNFLLGILLGAAVVYFVVVPSVRASVNSQAGRSVTAANEQMTESEAGVGNLNDQISELQSQVSAYESADASEKTKTQTYESMLLTYQYLQNSDTDSAKTEIDKADQSVLSDDLLTIYKALYKQAYAAELESDYVDGYNAVVNGNYATAVEKLEKVVEIDETYKDGEALYYLEWAYLENNQKDKGEEIYNKIAELYPKSVWAQYGKDKLSFASTQQSESDTSETGITSTDQGTTN
jgi:tetratricopeptide (TPR) repeat protein